MKPKKTKHHRAKLVVNTKTGEKFYSAAEVATMIKCSYGHLVNQLNGNIPNRTTFIYIE